MDPQSPGTIANPPLRVGAIPMGHLPCGPVCGTPTSPPLPGLPLQIAEPIPYQCITEGAIGPEDWHWSTAGHAPLLGDYAVR